MQTSDLKALIVDDHKMIRMLMRTVLNKIGISQILEAENGRVALEHCRQDVPHVVMLDWNMPEMNGPQFLEVLRQEPLWQNVLVILCSTENDIVRIQSMLSAGANEYIMKPFDVSIVQGKLVQIGVLEA